MANLWIMYKRLHLRKIECSLWKCVHLRSCLHLVFDHHDMTLIHVWFFLDCLDQYRALEIACLERHCLGVHSRCPWTLSRWHVIRAAWGYPNRRVLTWSPIFLIHELLNTIYIVYERSIGDIFFKILLFEEGKMPATVVHVTCHSLRQALSLPKRRWWWSWSPFFSICELSIF